MTNEAEVIENKLSQIVDLIEAPADNWWQIGIQAIELADLYNRADCEVDWSHDLCDDVEPFDLVAALYWHFSDYSEGQASHSYRVQCALSNIYQPSVYETSEGAEHSEAYHSLYKLLADKERLDLKGREGKPTR